MPNKNRKAFRESCLKRDNHNCVVPWCDNEPDEVHHIIERAEWKSGGYIEDNGASVCNLHHQYAESDYIPPQAFWFWLGIEEPITPSGLGNHIDKWGNSLEKPPWKEHRERIKYPSTRHLPFSNIGDKDDTYHRSVDTFLDIPLVITHKIDGSNAMIVKDTEHPVRARNGKRADHKSFSLLKDIYWRYNIHEKIPDNIQVFGEWAYAKHSIHYGCNCEDECVDVGPNLSELVNMDDERAYFQVFGCYHMDYDIWLSWSTVRRISNQLGFPTTPEVTVTGSEDNAMFEKTNVFYDTVYEMASDIISNGGEGLVVRSKFPFHYGQFEKRLGKYVRENHVKTDKHWSHQNIKPNNL
jgi:hypothetical protein